MFIVQSAIIAAFAAFASPQLAEPEGEGAAADPRELCDAGDNPDIHAVIICYKFCDGDLIDTDQMVPSDAVDEELSCFASAKKMCDPWGGQASSCLGA